MMQSIDCLMVIINLLMEIITNKVRDGKPTDDSRFHNFILQLTVNISFGSADSCYSIPAMNHKVLELSINKSDV